MAEHPKTIIPPARLKQICLVVLIGLLGWVLGKELFVFFPGLLGAFMLYVLLRGSFYKLTIVKGWKKWITATLFIIGSLLVIVLPAYLIVQMMLPKIAYAMSHANELGSQIDIITQKINKAFPAAKFKIDDAQTKKYVGKIMSSVPGFLGAFSNIFTNIVLAFFLLYFMLTDGRIMEREVQKFLSLKDRNIDIIWKETRTMVVANAVGLPVLAIFQGIFAAIGYAVFGVEEWLLWAVITGIFSLLPVIGTAIVWIPLTIYLYAIGDSGNGTGLLLYSILVITNIDNILRFTILKKLGDVHPIVTILGLIAGVPLFGFMGFIFGPLLISYLLLFIKVYRIEFSRLPAEELERM